MKPIIVALATVTAVVLTETVTKKSGASLTGKGVAKVGQGCIWLSEKMEKSEK